MDYILELRQYIGHRPLLVIGAGLLLVDAQNRLLLMKRSDNVSIVYLSHEWRGEIKLNDEHLEWNWFQADEIPEELSPPIKPIIEQFKSFSKANPSRNS